MFMTPEVPRPRLTTVKIDIARRPIIALTCLVQAMPRCRPGGKGAKDAAK